MFRKHAVGMITKNLPMQCVLKKMPKITVISRIRIFRQSIFLMHGFKRSVSLSRSLEKKNCFVISQNMNCPHMTQEFLQSPDIFRCCLRKWQSSAAIRRKQPTGLWAKFSVLPKIKALMWKKFLLHQNIFQI